VQHGELEELRERVAELEASQETPFGETAVLRKWKHCVDYANWAVAERFIEDCVGVDESSGGSRVAPHVRERR